MTRQRHLLTAIDLGNATFRVAIAEVISADRADLIGWGRGPSAGMRRGDVVDAELASGALRGVVLEAETMAGVEIDRAHVGIAGQHLRSVNSRGRSSFRKAREMTDREVDEVLGAAASIPLANERQVVARVARGFVVDGEVDRKADGAGDDGDPRGRIGSSLEAEVHLVTGARDRVKTSRDVVERVGIEVAQWAFSPLVAGRALLDESGGRGHALWLDLGAGLCQYALFHDTRPRQSGVLPVGGNHFTNDLAMVLRMSFGAAEELKLLRGTCDDGASPSQGDAEVPDVVGILRPRAEELLELVRDRLRAEGWEGRLAGGVMLAGGGSELTGFVELAERVFAAPARLARPRWSGLTGKNLPMSPGECTLVGLLADALEKGRAASPHRSLWGRWSDRLVGWASRSTAKLADDGGHPGPGPNAAAEEQKIPRSPQAGEALAAAPNTATPNTTAPATSAPSLTAPNSTAPSTPQAHPEPELEEGAALLEHRIRGLLVDRLRLRDQPVGEPVGEPVAGAAERRLWIEATFGVLEELALAIHGSRRGAADLRVSGRNRELRGIVEGLWEASAASSTDRPGPRTDPRETGAFFLERRGAEEGRAEAWMVGFREPSIGHFFLARGIASLLGGSSRRAGEILAEEKLGEETLGLIVDLLRRSESLSYRSALRWLAEESRRQGRGRLRGPWLGCNAVTLLYRVAGELPGNDWSNMMLEGADLGGADLRGKSFYGTSLRHADLRGALWHRVDLRQADLAGALLDRSIDAEGARTEGLEGERERRLFEASREPAP